MNGCASFQNSRTQKKPLVLRGGFGRYFLPTYEFGGSLGFSRVTTAQTTTPDYLPLATLSNPYPGGLLQPTGASLGLATGLGGAITFYDVNRRVPYVWQFSGGFQYEIVRGLLIDASYVGSRTYNLQVSKNINALPVDQLKQGTTYLSQAVANPFFGILPSNTTLGATATTQRRNLLVPYPQFSTITENAQSLGKSWYNSFQFRAEKRMSHGLTLLLSYTRFQDDGTARVSQPPGYPALAGDRHLRHSAAPGRQRHLRVSGGTASQVAEPRGRVAHHRRMERQLEHDRATRHTHQLPERLLHLWQPDALERADVEPLVRHLFQHLGVAAAGHAPDLEAP